MAPRITDQEYEALDEAINDYRVLVSFSSDNCRARLHELEKDCPHGFILHDLWQNLRRAHSKFLDLAESIISEATPELSHGEERRIVRNIEREGDELHDELVHYEEKRGDHERRLAADADGVLGPAAAAAAANQAHGCDNCHFVRNLFDGFARLCRGHRLFRIQRRILHQP